MTTWSAVEVQSSTASATSAVKRFAFETDSFDFANELVWAYHFHPQTGRTVMERRQPRPSYTHRCFVLARAARQFLYHARFDPARPVRDDAGYRRLIREVAWRDPRRPAAPNQQVVIPGYANLREFSRAHEPALKSECGGAWRSYVLRSHWRMVFPITRKHQVKTAEDLIRHLRQSGPPLIHLVRFPRLSINHGMVVFDVTEGPDGPQFLAYDPNDPTAPARLTFDRTARTFLLPGNAYWAGGPLDVIQIYRNWIL